MERMLIDRRKTSFFSAISNDLSYGELKLAPLMNRAFSIANFSEQIEEKSRSYNHSFREVLSKELNAQYKGLEIKNIVQSNIEALNNSNTFTVVTGHQLNLFGGPLYIIYKIAHIINLAKQVEAQHPTRKIVPVFWMASEDHDFEEINHLHLFGKKISWDSSQSGAVGRFSLTGITDFKQEVLDFFKNDSAAQEFIATYYTAADKNLANATRRLINDLFGQYGLVIIDGDSEALKRLFIPVMQKEIETSFSSQAVEITTKALVELGYKAQVTPREINLFYLDESGRTRIVEENGEFRVGDQLLSKTDLLRLIEHSPFSFSPNVVLRPIYQDFILPNLAYVGGGGEMAYWLQLKGVFDALNLTYPIIQVRNSFQLFDKGVMKKLDKLGLTPSNCFEDIHQLKKQFVMDNSTAEIDFVKLDELMEEISTEMETLIIAVDGGLKGYGQSEITRLNKQLVGVKDKLVRQQKKKFETSLQQIDAVIDKLFPNNGLQERHENMLSVGTKYGMHEFISMIFDACDPQINDLIVLKEKTE
jgi:bacillithiol synthase